MDTLIAVLRGISIGKYSSVLLFKGSSFQSSVLGGLITLAALAILLYYATFTLTDLS